MAGHNIGPYREFRLHAALRIGQFLSSTGQRRDPVEVHFQQSEFDAACGPHCIAMALVILGLARRSALAVMRTRKHGTAAGLYALVADCWMEGMFLEEMVSTLEALKLPLAIESQNGEGVDVFAVDALSSGRLVILAQETTVNRYRHFVLGIGCSGIRDGSTMTVDMLLCADPSVAMPPFAVANSTLRMTEPKKLLLRHRQTPVKWLCEASGHRAETVRLMSAVSLDLI